MSNGISEAEKYKTMGLFLDMAVSQGIDQAIATYGQIINAREARALTQMSQTELQALRDMNAKIAALSGAQGGGVTPNWACGVLC